MILSKEEKKIILMYRIEQERARTLLGAYDSYEKGMNKISRLQKRVDKLSGRKNYEGISAY